MAGRRRAPRGEGDRLREEILVAVGDLLTETQDEAAVSIRAIADRVGVTAPSIYRHFADKDALLDSVCASVFQSMLVGVRGRLSADQEPLQRLRAIGIGYIEFGLANPEHYRLVFMRRDQTMSHLLPGSPTAVPIESPLSATALAGSEAFSLLLETMTDLVALLPDRERPDVYVAATSMWSLVHGITSLRIAKSGFDWPPYADELDAVLLPWRIAIGG
jgi:AcrR family transcriptional regulator